MKQNQKGRYNGRYNNTGRGFRSQTILRSTALESTGPCGKIHGTALQLFEKYQAAAKDAQIQNDDILAETCLQYADHYMHLQNIAIANEQAMKNQQKQSPSNDAAKAKEGAVEKNGSIKQKKHSTDSDNTSVSCVSGRGDVCAIVPDIEMTETQQDSSAYHKNKEVKPSLHRNFKKNNQEKSSAPFEKGNQMPSVEDEKEGSLDKNTQGRDVFDEDRLINPYMSEVPLMREKKKDVSDGELQSMDLSIPIADMEANHKRKADEDQKTISKRVRKKSIRSEKVEMVEVKADSISEKE